MKNYILFKNLLQLLVSPSEIMFKLSGGVFRKLQTPAALHPGQALLGAAEFVRKQ